MRRFILGVTLSLLWMGAAAMSLAVGATVESGKSPHFESAEHLYLFSTFENAQHGLIFKYSTDGIQWSSIMTGYSYVDPSNLRDPSWIQVGDTFYVAYTLAYPAVTNAFQIIKSTDLVNWQPVATLEVTQVAGGGQAWAPEWFYDKKTGQYCLIVTGVTAGFYPMRPYVFTAISSDLSIWSASQEVTGTNFPGKVIDSFIEEQSGIYYLFYNNNDTGYVEVATSTQRDSGYTVIKSGDWAGWGSAFQGPSLVRLPDGRWRIYLDSYGERNGVKQFYSESATSDLATTSWSPVTGLTTLPGIVSLCEHGTFREIFPTRKITLNALPSGSGATGGGGAVIQGNAVTVTATPQIAYSFTNWTENGSLVSVASSYSFTATGDRNLVANFLMKPFYQWWTSHVTSGGLDDLSVSGPAATPLQDGTANVLKYLCNIDPALALSDSDRAALPRSGVETRLSVNYLTLTYRRNRAATDLTVQVQTSVDLQSWSTVTPDFIEELTTDASTGDPIRKVGVSTGGATNKFIRLNLITP